jgi:hypothetical protein
MLPRLTAPMAAALSGRRPTMMVSTMPMTFQPISAITSGQANASSGRHSCRMFSRADIYLASHTAGRASVAETPPVQGRG